MGVHKHIPLNSTTAAAFLLCLLHNMHTRKHDNKPSFSAIVTFILAILLYIVKIELCIHQKASYFLNGTNFFIIARLYIGEHFKNKQTRFDIFPKKYFTFFCRYTITSARSSIYVVVIEEGTWGSAQR